LPVQVSHIKAAGRPHWGRVKDALALIDAARARGLDVMADVYPYTASSTTIRTLLPDSALEGGIEAMLGRLRDPAARVRIRGEMAHGAVLARGIDWGDIMIAYAPSRPEAQGLSLDEVGRRWGKDPVECAFDIIEAEKGKGYVILFQLDESDLRRALVHSHVMIGSDGSSLAATGPLSEGKPHPRSYGTFVRVLGRYARERRVIPLAEAVRKMTSFPAQRAGLLDRGVLRPGMKADITVFDPDTVKPLPEFIVHDFPAGGWRFKEPAQGIYATFVNGQMLMKEGEHTGALPGRVLRNSRYQASHG